ncbi:MAG: class I SAM-dependent rRNA methyltransferase [Bdellovibrionaceae bacterium]|jgi:23S rRNA (cytosine1962-C5)-methyltransferase|nr:class I SAM-dependent rRNA methyltransferase [Pseudobdellovibrionaceae bacterium]
MKLVRTDSKYINLRLAKNLNRDILRGHPWVYRDALQSLPKSESGVLAKLFDKSNKFLAYGFYDPQCELCFRVCSLDEKQKLNNFWARNLLEQALRLRTGKTFRLFNGEGDGLPGLVCDVYNEYAVIQLDGYGPKGFWELEGLTSWLDEHLSLKGIVYKPRGDLKLKAQVLKGKEEDFISAEFLENNVKFQANLLEGQKTGFFLDQKDNRHFIQGVSKNLRVLNLFSYTGGFSVYAGIGGAKHVTSVDISRPATDQAITNWQINGLDNSSHIAVAENVFDFLDKAIQEKQKWDLVIVDPPSFAHAKSNFKEAVESYERIFTQSIKVCETGGLVALSSCSSHITPEKFLDISSQCFSKARKRAKVITVKGQSADHPYPLACLEMQYLKFVLFQCF